MNAHPASALFPMLGRRELEALAADIREHGLLHPILTYRGEILDGRNRLAACEMAGVEPTFEEWAGENGSTPVSFVVSENLKRRHLSISQRAMLGVELLPLFEAEAKERQAEFLRKGAIAPVVTLGTQPPPKSRDRVAEVMGVSGMSVQRARAVATRDPELAAKVRAGEITVKEAARKVGWAAAEKSRIPRVTVAKRHHKMLELLAQFARYGEQWEPENCLALTPPEASKQLTVIRKARDILDAVTQEVELRAARPHSFLGR